METNNNSLQAILSVFHRDQEIHTFWNISSICEEWSWNTVKNNELLQIVALAVTPKSFHHSRQNWFIKSHSQKIKTPKLLELSLSSAVSSTRWGSNSKPPSPPQEQKSWRTWTWSIWAVTSQKCIRTSLMQRFVLFTKSGPQNHTPAGKDLILTRLNGWRRQ